MREGHRVWNTFGRIAMMRRFGMPSLLIVALVSLLIAGLAQAGAPHQLSALQASPEATPCGVLTADQASEMAITFLDPFVTGDVGIYDQILAPNYVHHWGFGEDAFGVEEQKARVAAFAATFGLFQWEERIAIVADEYVTVRWTATARQVEPLNGIAPSDVEATYTGINIFRIECGLIAEAWSEADHLGRLIQAGVITDDELADIGTPTP
jgi:hypothetical protein